MVTVLSEGGSTRATEINDNYRTGIIFLMQILLDSMNNWFCSEKELDACLPTTPHFMSLQLKVVVEGSKATPLVSYLLREKMGYYSHVSPAAPRLDRLGTHLGMAGTTEGQQKLGDMAGGASCLRVVLQSLGDDPYKQEDLQSLQGLVGQ